MVVRVVSVAVVDWVRHGVGSRLITVWGLWERAMKEDSDRSRDR